MQSVIHNIYIYPSCDRLHPRATVHSSLNYECGMNFYIKVWMLKYADVCIFNVSSDRTCGSSLLVNECPVCAGWQCNPSFSDNSWHLNKMASSSEDVAAASTSMTEDGEDFFMETCNCHACDFRNSMGLLMLILVNKIHFIVFNVKNKIQLVSSWSLYVFVCLLHDLVLLNVVKACHLHAVTSHKQHIQCNSSIQI